MAKICPLYSGSTGNSTYISTNSSAILIDAGGSLKGIAQGISAFGENISKVKAVAITHEHEDHIKGLTAVLRKTGAALIGTRGTLSWLDENQKIPQGTRIIEISDKIEFEDFLIENFETSHDCRQPCGYSVTLSNGKKISVCTDLGIVTPNVRAAITKSDLILLESNHDIEMLKRGPYPPNLKMRILSDSGHISNNACATELKSFIRTGTTRFILGHLSQKNNTPLIARSCAEAALMDEGAVNGKDYLLYVAAPTGNGATVI